MVLGRLFHQVHFPGLAYRLVLMCYAIIHYIENEKIFTYYFWAS